jgi:hypothetical protein
MKPLLYMRKKNLQGPAFTKYAGMKSIMAAKSGAWSPVRMFSQGEKGAWYDASDFSTMFQDSAGTTPVTAVGQPVGLIRDKSGNGNHLLQAVAAKRPVLEQVGSGFALRFTAANLSSMSTAGMVVTGGVDVFTCVGQRRATNAALGVMFESSSAYAANPGSWRITSPNSAANNAGFATNNTNAVTVVSTGILNNVNYALSGRVKAVGAPTVISTKTDKNNWVDTVADVGASNYGNFILFVGARNNVSSYFNGHLFSTIIRFTAETTNADADAAAEYTLQKMQS